MSFSSDFAPDTVTALFEIVPAALSGASSTPALARGPIATLRLRCKEPNGRRSIPLSTTIADEGHSAYEASPDMQFATAIAQFGMLLRDSPHKGTSSWTTSSSSPPSPAEQTWKEPARSS